jgi:hypothetical protein
MRARFRRIAWVLVRLSPAILMPGLAFVIGFQLLPYLMMPLVTLRVGVLAGGYQDPPGPADEEGGGGGGPPRPRTPKDRPPGGIPLTDAVPGRFRLRQHGDRPADRRPARRPAHAPRRSPTRTPDRAARTRSGA